MGAFYRKINGYIDNYASDETIDGATYFITRPQSRRTGLLRGGGISWGQFFDFLPSFWNGLGVQVNFTYIEGHTKSPLGMGRLIETTPLENVSNRNYNVGLIYEKYCSSGSLNLTHRSSCIMKFNSQVSQTRALSSLNPPTLSICRSTIP